MCKNVTCSGFGYHVYRNKKRPIAYFVTRNLSEFQLIFTHNLPYRVCSYRFRVYSISVHTPRICSGRKTIKYILASHNTKRSSIIWLALQNRLSMLDRASPLHLLPIGLESFSIFYVENNEQLASQLNGASCWF